MTITAKIIKDTVWKGHRATTFLLRYPRFIHAEFMTHRTISRNASSSRAIPVNRIIQDIMDDPAMPIHWGQNQPGMQADKEFVGTIYDPENDIYGVTPQQAWLIARDEAVKVASAMAKAGLHKQVVNRIIEPFSHITVLATATSWDNFFHLRRHKDAQPEIRELARVMYDLYRTNQPFEGYAGYWHLPFVDLEPGSLISPDHFLIKQCVAKSARTSYLTHDGRPSTLDEDLGLYDRLVGGIPLHASPAEHQLMCSDGYIGLNGNMAPVYVQYRKTLPYENCTAYDPAEFDAWWGANGE